MGVADAQPIEAELLNNLGITNLASGLTDAQLQQILQALGQI